MMYSHSSSNYQHEHFEMFSYVVENSSATITQDWVIDFNNGMETLDFCMANHSYASHIFNMLITTQQLVCKAIFKTSIMQMRGQCSIVANMLIIKLDQHFVDFELINAFGIVYPQFWMQFDADFSFSLHMVLIKKHYCEATKVKPSLLQVAKPFDANLLDLQMCIFKYTMKMQVPKVMAKPFDTNPMTKLWVTISNNALLTQWLNKYLKLLEITVVLVLESIEDEQTFSTLTFMKNKLRNRLSLHLDTIVRMFAHEFYIQENFPYEETITTWKDQKVRIGGAP